MSGVSWSWVVRVLWRLVKEAIDKEIISQSLKAMKAIIPTSGLECPQPGAARKEDLYIPYCASVNLVSWWWIH